MEFHTIVAQSICSEALITFKKNLLIFSFFLLLSLCLAPWASWRSSQFHDQDRTKTWRTCESDTLGSYRMAPKTNVLLLESLRTRGITDRKACFFDLRASSYEVFSLRRSSDSLSLLKLCRDLCLTQAKNICIARP